MKRENIVDALKASNGNAREAARRLGISPPTLYRDMRRHGIPLRTGVKPFTHVSTALPSDSVNDSSNSFEYSGQGGVSGPTLNPVATQATAAQPMAEARGRSPRTVHMTDEDTKAVNDAMLDIAFYTRRKQGFSDVVSLLIRRKLPELLLDVRSEEPEEGGTE